MKNFEMERPRVKVNLGKKKVIPQEKYSCWSSASKRVVTNSVLCSKRLISNRYVESVSDVEVN